MRIAVLLFELHMFLPKSEFLSKMFILKGSDKKIYSWKTKAVIFNSYHYSLDVIMLMLLSKFEFDGRFHLLKTKNYKKQTLWFPLKPDDINEMTSTVHEWKCKPRSIVWYRCLMQQIIRNKVILHESHLKGTIWSVIINCNLSFIYQNKHNFTKSWGLTTNPPLDDEGE